MGDGRKWAHEYEDDVGELKVRVEKNPTAKPLVDMMKQLKLMGDTKPFTKDGFRRLTKIQSHLEDLIGESITEYPRGSHWGKASIKDIL